MGIKVIEIAVEEESEEIQTDEKDPFERGFHDGFVYDLSDENRDKFNTLNDVCWQDRLFAVAPDALDLCMVDNGEPLNEWLRGFHDGLAHLSRPEDEGVL